MLYLWAMRLLGKKLLDQFFQEHADARAPLGAWVLEVDAAQWKTTIDIKQRFPSASFLAGNVVVFNIKGNTYRLVSKVEFVTAIVLVTRIGTHAEYSKWTL